MTKIRKHNGAYKLQIHKHSKVRRPKSMWLFELTAIQIGGITYPAIYHTHITVPKYTSNEIKTNLPEPLDLTLTDWASDDFDYTKPFKGFKIPEQKGYWEEVIRVEELLFGKPKPSILTRVKERFKR